MPQPKSKPFIPAMSSAKKPAPFVHPPLAFYELHAAKAKKAGITRTPKTKQPTKLSPLDEARFREIETYLRDPKRSIPNRAAQLKYLEELRRVRAKAQNGRK